jgi:hypothetical protein
LASLPPRYVLPPAGMHLYTGLMMTWIRQQLDIDQLLIFFLLGVTITQMGYYLASFQPWGQWWVGYLQAVAVDAAIWRSAWWYRRYRGKKQRRWALTGVVAFALVSAWYNFGFYTLQRPSLPVVQRALMGVVLPAGVALLSYLKGTKDESAFAMRERETKEKEPTITIEEPQANPEPEEELKEAYMFFKCEQCKREFRWPSKKYPNQRSAQNAMNAHKCEAT